MSFIQEVRIICFKCFYQNRFQIRSNEMNDMKTCIRRCSNCLKPIFESQIIETNVQSAEI